MNAMTAMWTVSVVMLWALCAAGADPATTGTAPTAGEARAYAVRFEPPAEVGQRRRVRQHMVQRIERSLRRGDQTQQDERSQNTIDFSAIVEVLAVDRRGYETKDRITIERAVLTPAGAPPQTILPRGAVVIAESSRQGTTYAAAAPGETLSPLAQRLLPQMFSTVNPGDITAKDIFSQPDPQRVGDRWEADRQRLADMLRTLDASLTPADVSGGARLDHVRVVDGREYLHLVYDIAATGNSPRNPPENMLPLRATVEIHGTVEFPADYHAGSVIRTQRKQWEGHFRGRPGTSSAGTTSMHRSFETVETEAEYLHSTDDARGDLPAGN